MRFVTLDTNCLIDLSENRPDAAAIRVLIDRHTRKQIELRLPAISASEKQLEGTYLDNFHRFKQRVEVLGLGQARLLKPIGYYDVTYWDYCLSPDDRMTELERRIHDILHPRIEYKYRDYCVARSLNPDAEPIEHKWRNAKCDVLVAWSHIHYGGHLLVTRDYNFHKAAKLQALVGLGAGKIVFPTDAPARLDPGA